MESNATSAPRAELRRALLDHYDAHRRRLPWRAETDPYRVLVSEVMLQQTRVHTVSEYYGRWLERFPDVQALAAAEVDEVLEVWEGLGYYRRARNLHAAARLVRERPDGEIPGSYVGLRELPGVGEYTAGAVASIAFGEAVPAVDGNVRRVLARLHDVAQPKPAWLRGTAAALVDPDRPGDWNQALMDLGATVCTPRTPSCPVCPVATWCAARAAGTEEERPAADRRRAPRPVVFAVAVMHHSGRVLLRRRPADGLLGGMWAFPEAEVESVEEAVGAIRGIVAAATGVDDVAVEPDVLATVRHRFTHIDATYVPWLVEWADTSAGGADVRWVEMDRPAGVALPVAQRRILDGARDRLGAGCTTWQPDSSYRT
jgi:A/G-specific adenine glycosylase